MNKFYDIEKIDKFLSDSAYPYTIIMGTRCCGRTYFYELCMKRYLIKRLIAILKTINARKA